MRIHQDILEVVNKRVLPDIVRVHEMDVPYPAELWVDGNCEHQDGTAMFSIGDGGFLTAEYFGYDNVDRMPSETMGPRPVSPKLVIKDTKVEIPIWHLSNSYKARTIYSIPMPAVQAYECEVQGWIGSSDHTPMQSAAITISDLPDLRFPKASLRISEESTHLEAMTMRGMETKNAVLTLEAGDWKIQLAEGTDWRQESEPLYHATLTKKDGSPFTLGDDDINNGIIDALRQFLSFQCEAWVNIPTIVCNPVFSITEKSLSLRYGETDQDIIHAVSKCRASENAWPEALDKLGDILRNSPGFEDVSDGSLSGLSISKERARISFSKGSPLLERAWINKLPPRSASNKSSWTASDWQKWPDLFKGFWTQHSKIETKEYLNNAVFHYVRCSEMFENDPFEALAAAQSTLQALTRWWTGKAKDYHFRKGEFQLELPNAAINAELGTDNSKTIDYGQMKIVIRKAGKYRNDIDHGMAGNIGTEIQSVAACQMYYQNLARLLILAKLGDRDTDQRGNWAGPIFIEKET